jgi:hypothetical protein
MNWKKVIEEYTNYMSENPFRYQPLHEWLDERYELPKHKPIILRDEKIANEIFNDYKNSSL